VALNGHTIPGQMLTGLLWNKLYPFTIPAGNPYFVQGLNTLDFTVQDTGGYAGFMMSSLSGTANPITP
jgi:hypothetical protein